MIVILIFLFSYLEASEWISIKDQPPPEKEKVLIWDASHITMYAVIYKDYLEYWYYECDFEVDVTHWMLLPAPPTLDSNSYN